MIKELEEKWDHVCSQLKTVWHDLTASDLEKTQASLQAAIDFLKEKYGGTEEEVVNKLEEILRKMKETKDNIL